MSISTRSGDDGSTGLMYGRRISKADLRVETYGNLDELNAALGLVRVDAVHPLVRESVAALQKTLVLVMGELATHEEDVERYREGGQAIGPEALKELDEAVRVLEEEHKVSFQRWAVPGEAGSRAGAFLDLARTVARRGERGVVRLVDEGLVDNPTLLPWLNRLSDLCWLLARLEETSEPG